MVSSGFELQAEIRELPGRFSFCLNVGSEIFGISKVGRSWWQLQSKNRLES